MHTEYTTGAQNLQGPITLHDVSLTGRVRPWRQHRLEAELLAEAYQAAACRVSGPEVAGWAARADKVQTCGTHPIFERHRSSDGDYMTLKSANFCRDRLCPLCQWRRSLKLGAQCRAVVAEADRRKIARDRVSWRWVMLTLTQRNVDGPDLAAELDKMHAALKVMTKSPRWRAAAQGWLRVTEITRNSDRRSSWYGSYHPHMHILIAVHRRYFKSRDYIPAAEWGAMWRTYMHLNYDPDIDVRVVTAKGQTIEDATDPAQSMGAAVAEVTKYAAKPGSYLVASDLDGTVEAVTTLAQALHGRRLCAWGGVCKEAAQALRLDSLETGDLVHIDEDSTGDPAADAVGHYVAYHWALGIRNYVQGREWDAAPSWAEAAQAAKDRPKLAALQRAKEVADMTSNLTLIRRLQGAAGERLANRVVRSHDAYNIQLLKEVAAARDRQGVTAQVPGPTGQDGAPCGQETAGD